MRQKKYSPRFPSVLTFLKPSLLFSVFFALFLLLGNSAFAERSQIATGHSGMVVTSEEKATHAAIAILRRGGNAIDAAIAAQWVLNVVEPQSSGIGGGGFLLFYDAKTGEVHSFDGRETAPENASAQMFLDDRNEVLPFWPDRISGGLAVGVPGTLKLLEHVHHRFSSGHFTFGELFQPAIKIAEQGFDVSERLAFFLLQEKDRLALFPETKKIFFSGDNPVVAGQTIFQKDLANTFKQISYEGTDLFYKGTLAEQIVRAIQEAPFNPGRMSLEDLYHYKVVERKPVHAQYRGYDLYGMGPPSSGGVTTFQALKILSNFDLKKFSKIERLFIMGEAQRIAFEDRDRYIADPDQILVPSVHLLSDTMAGYFAREIKNKLQGMKLSSVKKEVVREEGDQTSHLSIVDREGNVVSFTTTIEYLFGSGMIVPGRGFFLNNELSDFEAYPWDENDRLHVNAASPRKRPRSSMSPTLVMKDDKPWIVLGSPGGSTIIGTVINLLVNTIDLDLSLVNAMKEPKVIHRGNHLELEETFFIEGTLASELETQKIGYEKKKPFGNAQALIRKENQFIGVSDLRGQGKAEGF